MCTVLLDAVPPALTGAAPMHNSEIVAAAAAAGNISKSIQPTVVTAITHVRPGHYSIRHVPASWPTTAPVAGVL